MRVIDSKPRLQSTAVWVGVALSLLGTGLSVLGLPRWAAFAMVACGTLLLTLLGLQHLQRRAPSEAHVDRARHRRRPSSEPPDQGRVSALNLHLAFGAMLRAHRDMRGLTQAELGARVGLSPSAISRLEHGRCSARQEVVFQLALALGIEPDELLHGLDREPRRMLYGT